MVKKAVLFDLDNTLYDYDTPHKTALKKVYQTLRSKIKITEKEFGRLFDISKKEIHRELAGTASSHNRILYFQRLIEKTHSTVEPGLILKLYSAYWDTLLSNMKPGKDVVKTLKTLQKNKIKIAVVSDLTTHIQLRKIKKLGLTKYIDYLVTSEEAGSEKPHSIMFLLALNKLGLKPEEAFMVGDNTINDIEGANSVGMDTVLIKRGNLAKKSKESYQKPNYVIREIGELINILDV